MQPEPEATPEELHAAVLDLERWDRERKAKNRAERIGATDLESERSTATLPDQQEHESQAPTEPVTEPEQPKTALEKLQARDELPTMDELIDAFKADNGLRRTPDERIRAVAAARTYLLENGGQPARDVREYVRDLTGYSVPRNGKGRTRFLREAGIERRPHYRKGRTGREYTEWFIPQDSPVQVIAGRASNPEGQSASNPAQSASNPPVAETPSDRVQVILGRVKAIPIALSALARPRRDTCIHVDSYGT
jgi:hypothetical protein